jgi:putative transposase
LHGKKIVLLDRVTKFSSSFQSILKDAGIEPTFTPPKSPNYNAHIERFFLSLKSECLSRLIFFSESTLLVAIAKYVDHYHRHRNHQGVGNLRIEPPPDEPLCDKIICEEELGGLLNYYRRQAA